MKGRLGGVIKKGLLAGNGYGEANCCGGGGKLENKGCLVELAVEAAWKVKLPSEGP